MLFTVYDTTLLQKFIVWTYFKQEVITIPILVIYLLTKDITFPKTPPLSSQIDNQLQDHAFRHVFYPIKPPSHAVAAQPPKPLIEFSMIKQITAVEGESEQSILEHYKQEVLNLTTSRGLQTFKNIAISGILQHCK